jgi:hypothetical protein
MNRELRKELTVPDFERYEDQELAEQNGDCRFWFYLREHLMQDDWPEYSGGEPRHESADAFRYFTISVSKDDLSGTEVFLEVYWEHDDESPAEAVLHTVITAKKDDVSSTVEAMYDLEISDYDDEPQEDPDDPLHGQTAGDESKWIWAVHKEGSGQA